MPRINLSDSVTPPMAIEMGSRVLRNWASDVLSLRRRGLDRPSFRRGRWNGQNLAPGPWPFAEARRRAA